MTAPSLSPADRRPGLSLSFHFRESRLNTHHHPQVGIVTWPAAALTLLALPVLMLFWFVYTAWHTLRRLIGR